MIIHQTSSRKPNSKIMGGKAANLLFLSQKDYSVPEFFILTTSFFAKKISPQKIYQFFDQLNCKTVSVRSSVNVEDGQRHSFAGIFESYLNIKKQDLIKTIKKCHDSAFSNRAKQYCNFHQIDYKKIRPDVIVQKMVSPGKGGVIFTQDENNQIVIEACQGNGEKVVDGTADISQYMISRQTKKPNHTNGILNQKEISKLINTSLKIEDEFNSPQDIEWAIKNNKIFILQSRPITI